MHRGDFSGTWSQSNNYSQLGHTDEFICNSFTDKYYFHSLYRDGEISRGALAASDHKVSHTFVPQQFFRRAATGVLLKPPGHTHTGSNAAAYLMCMYHTHTHTHAHLQPVWHNLLRVLPNKYGFFLNRLMPTWQTYLFVAVSCMVSGVYSQKVRFSSSAAEQTQTL